MGERSWGSAGRPPSSMASSSPSAALGFSCLSHPRSCSSILRSRQGFFFCSLTVLAQCSRPTVAMRDFLI